MPFRNFPQLNPAAIATPVGLPLGTRRNALCWDASAFYTLAAGETQQVLWEVPDDVDYVQMVMGNVVNTAYTADRALVGPTSKVGTQPNLYDASGAVTTTAWVPAYTDNAGVDAAPIPYRNPSARSLSIPASTLGANIASWTFYDPVPIKTIPRLDKANGSRLVATRIYSANGMPATNLTEAAVGTAPLLGIDLAEFAITGDGVTTPTLTAGGSFGYCAPAILRFWTRHPGISVLAVGDSTVLGYNTSTGIVNAFNRACAAVSKPGTLSVTCNSQGWSGQTTTQFGQRGLDLISRFKPQIVCWLTASPNDVTANGVNGLTQALMDTAWNYTSAAAQLCHDVGAVFIPITPLPWFNMTPTLDAIRLTAKARAYQAFPLVLDYDGMLGNGGNPNVLNTAFDAGDHVHPNDAGHAAVATGVGAPQGSVPLVALIHEALGI